MKISVITATYNCGKTLRTSLESIAAQTHPDIEHLIIDGGSQDDTLNLIRDWNFHALTWESGKDKGIYDALNKGIDKASGEIIGFLHADDVFQDKNVLEKVARAFEDPQVEAVYGDLVYVAQDDLRNVVRTWKSGSFSHSKLHRGWMPPHPTFYVRRSLYKKFGKFDLQYRIAADYDNMLRILCKINDINVTYIEHTLVRMRTGGISNRSLKNIIQKTREDIKIAKANNIGGFLTILIKNSSKLRQFFK